MSHTYETQKICCFLADVQIILVSLFEFFDYIKVAKNAGAFLSRCSELLALCHNTNVHCPILLIYSQLVNAYSFCDVDFSLKFKIYVQLNCCQLVAWQFLHRYTYLVGADFLRLQNNLCQLIYNQDIIMPDFKYSMT